MNSKIVTSSIRFLLLGAFFLLLFFPDIFQIRLEYPGWPLKDPLFLRFCKLAFWLLVSIELLRCFYYGIVKSKLKGFVPNLLTLFISLSLLFVFLEMVFMFVPQSHEGVSSKASQVWWSKHWFPENTLGYRDTEPAAVKGQKVVLAIGDSFTAGHGLKDVNERFSNRLEARLGNGYRVHNLGVSGADSGDEASRLETYPLKPDAIVLQYFPNDIEKVAQAGGIPLTGTQPYDDLGRLGTHLVRRFYLPNFIYWQLPHTQFSTFESFISQAYTDSTVLSLHLADMDRMIACRDSAGADMYAVFIPFLMQLDKSAGYTKIVEDYLRSKGVTVLTFTDEIAAIPEKDRIVGKNDGHASAAVNQVIADALYRAFSQNQSQH